MSGFLGLAAALSGAGVLAMMNRPSWFRLLALGVLSGVILAAFLGPSEEPAGVATVGIAMAAGALFAARRLQAKGMAPAILLLGSGVGLVGGLLLGLTVAVNLGLLTP